MLVPVPAVLTLSSCIKDAPVTDNSTENKDNADIMEYADYSLYFDSGIDETIVRTFDILIYSAEGLKELEQDFHIGWSGESGMEPEDIINNGLGFQALDGSKIVAIIANSPKKLNIKALARYDNLSGLNYDFKDENTAYPVMTAIGGFQTHEHEAIITRLTPILSMVELVSISNTLDDYELLESPRIRLRTLNANIKPFEDGPYYPKATIDYGEWEELPYDIGFYPQNPSTVLYCYPNWAGSSSFCTEMELECKIRGRLRSFRFDIPTIARNAHLLIEITINEDDEEIKIS